MVIITSTELTTNMNKYLDLLDTEDIIIIRNGRKVAKIIKEDDSEPNLQNMAAIYGILKNSELSKLSDDELKNIIREERNIRYDSNDWHEYYVTRNIKDFVNSPIKAIIPSEFIKI